MACRIRGVGFVTVSERKSETGVLMPRSSQNERGEGEKEPEEVNAGRPAPSGIRAAHPRLPKIFFEGE
jgi:hypothetical protein